MDHRPNEEAMEKTKSGDGKQGDCYLWLTRGYLWLTRENCSKGYARSFKNDASKKGRSKGERERKRSPSPGSRPPSDKDGNGSFNRLDAERYQSIWWQGASAVSKESRKRPARNPSCDYWHPPDCVKHNAKERRSLGEKCFFLHAGKSKTPNMKSGSKWASDKVSIAMVCNVQKLGSVSEVFF